MRKVMAVLAAVLLAGCASAPTTTKGDQVYIDRRLNGDRVVYRHLKAQIVTDAVTREASRFCKERGREAFFVTRIAYGSTQLLSSFDCRKPVPRP